MGSGSNSQDNTGINSAVQFQLNQAAAKAQQQLNMVGQDNPYGNLSWVSDPNQPGGYTAKTTLSAPQQNIFNNQEAAKTGMSAAANNLINSGAGGFSGKPIDLSWGATEGQIDKLNKNTLDPQWQQASNQEAARLAQQGITPGSEGYDAAMRTFNNSKNNAYDQMYLQGHNTAVNDITNQYNSPVNTANSMLTGSAIQNPNSSYVATPQESIAAPNFLGAEQNFQQMQQQQNAANNAAGGGLMSTGGQLLGSLIGAMAMMSDEDTKTDIEPAGQDPETGVELSSYRYKGDPESYPKVVSPMAQDVERRFPGSTRSIAGRRVIPGGLGRIGSARRDPIEKRGIGRLGMGGKR
jgi:hypothetical protein